MYLHLDHHSGEPVYRQIVEAIKYQVASGGLPEGEKLASIRVLAEQLHINPRTVVKAYEELEHAGLVVSRHGQGVFVTANSGSIPLAARRKTVAEMARRLLAEAMRLGAEKAEILEILQQEADKMEPDR